MYHHYSFHRSKLNWAQCSYLLKHYALLFNNLNLNIDIFNKKKKKFFFKNSMSYNIFSRFLKRINRNNDDLDKKHMFLKNVVQLYYQFSELHARRKTSRLYASYMDIIVTCKSSRGTARTAVWVRVFYAYDIRIVRVFRFPTQVCYRHDRPSRGKRRFSFYTSHAESSGRVTAVVDLLRYTCARVWSRFFFTDSPTRDPTVRPRVPSDALPRSVATRTRRKHRPTVKTTAAARRLTTRTSEEAENKW